MVYGIWCARAARAAICSGYRVKGCFILEFTRGIAFSIRRIVPDYGPRARRSRPPYLAARPSQPW